MIIFIFFLFFTTINAQTSDLIKQADELFIKLNSNNTDRIISNIFTNIEVIVNHINSPNTYKKTRDITNNLNQLLDTLNNNDTKEIIHNIKKITDNSKIYIDINDTNWKINKMLIYIEIVLILLIIILTLGLFLCIYKIFKKKYQENNEIFTYYNNMENN